LPSATPGEASRAGSEWLHEIKFDGYRPFLTREGDRVHLPTKDINAFF